MTAKDFLDRFDATGIYLKGDGTENVVFTTPSDIRFPGKFQFCNGLCVGAATDIGNWNKPDGSPIDGIRFLLEFDDEKKLVAIDQGKIIRVQESKRSGSRRDFLSHFRIARNLFVHPQVSPDSPVVDAEKTEKMLVRAAIWLTPKSVFGFDPADFQELGKARQKELEEAVQEFLAVANHVPPDEPATEEQFRTASVPFQKLLDILGAYLTMREDAKVVEQVLRGTTFPPWVLNWDYEFKDDSDGEEAIWVNVYADEKSIPYGQIGKELTDFSMHVRQELVESKIDCWPHIRLKTAKLHKAGGR